MFFVKIHKLNSLVKILRIGGAGGAARAVGRHTPPSLTGGGTQLVKNFRRGQHFLIF